MTSSKKEQGSNFSFRERGNLTNHHIVIQISYDFSSEGRILICVNGLIPGPLLELSKCRRQKVTVLRRRLQNTKVIERNIKSH